MTKRLSSSVAGQRDPNRCKIVFSETHFNGTNVRVGLRSLLHQVEAMPPDRNVSHMSYDPDTRNLVIEFEEA